MKYLHAGLSLATYRECRGWQKSRLFAKPAGAEGVCESFVSSEMGALSLVGDFCPRLTTFVGASKGEIANALKNLRPLMRTAPAPNVDVFGTSVVAAGTKIHVPMKPAETKMGVWTRDVGTMRAVWTMRVVGTMRGDAMLRGVVMMRGAGAMRKVQERIYVQGRIDVQET